MDIRYLQGLSVMIGLFFMFSPFAVSSDTVVWCDGFDNGTCDDWTVVYGDWQVTDGYLKSQSSTGTRIITHNSSQAEGTWSFDVFHESPDDAHESNYMFMTFGAYPNLCYGYGILISGESICFVKQDGELSTLRSLGCVIVRGLVNTWTHFDITRNSSTAEFNVYINATSTSTESDINVVDTAYDFSEQFVARGIGCNCYLDNVTLDNQIAITTITTNLENNNSLSMDPVLLTLGGAGVVIIAMLIAMIHLKKK